MAQSTVKTSNGATPPADVDAGTEVILKAKRRTFTAAYKQQILQAADACDQPGQVGALLRREGLYSSHLTSWRRQRDRGELIPKPRGKPADPQAKEVARLHRQVEHLQAKLSQAETIIEVQKKLCSLFGLPVAETPPADNR